MRPSGIEPALREEEPLDVPGVGEGDEVDSPRVNFGCLSGVPNPPNLDLRFKGVGESIGLQCVPNTDGGMHELT